MKNIRLLTFVLIIGTLLLSACGAGAPASTATAPGVAGDAKVQAMPVSFVGVVDSIAGDQWVISGTTVTVDASIVRDGPFHVGDQVKVEGHVSPNGSFTVSRVEAPTPQETATLPPLGDDNSNSANTNDATNVNDDHGNDVNINDDHGVDTNVNDDQGNDTNINDDNGGAGNTNDDNSNVNSPSNNNTNDDHGGKSSGGNDNGSSGKGSGGGNDNGGNSNGN